MPNYRVTDPTTGKTITLTGDAPPTEQELEQVFAQLSRRASEAPAPPQAAPTWADKAGLQGDGNTFARGYMDVLEGAASGLMNTAYQGGDLIRRALGMERVIDTPEAQRAMTAPASPSGQAGRFAEQAAEFAVPLGAVSKTAAGLSVLPRLAMEGAAGAATAGVQSGGDPEAMATGGLAGALLPPAVSGAMRAGRAAVGAVRNAAAAASEEGISGAVAATLRRAGAVDPKAAMIQALKPQNTRVNFGRELGVAMPELKAVAEETGRPIQSLADLMDATKAAKQRIWQQYEQLLGPQRAMRASIDLSPVADAIERSIPKRTALQDPARAEAMQRLAQSYRRRFSIDDAEQLLQETNADLDAYYNKFPAAKRGAQAANPDTAATVAEAEALRTAIYAHLDDVGDGAAARELKRRYGALLEIDRAAMKRQNVAARQQPESLSEQVGKVRAAADMARGTWRMLHGDLTGAADIAASRAGSAMSTFLKEQQTTDALIRRAFEAFEGRPVPVEMPPPVRIAGELPPASIRSGPAPDPSYVRAVPGEYAQPGIRPGQKALPPAPTVRPMPAAPDLSGVRATTPGRMVQRDPRTGRMKRVYSSEPSEK